MSNDLTFCRNVPNEDKQAMSKWLKDYIEKEKALQAKIDADPDAITLYTYEIDIDTLKITARESKHLSYDEKCTGYAEFEESSESRRVYAESLVSKDDARNLVEEFCLKFGVAGLEVQKDNFYDI